MLEKDVPSKTSEFGSCDLSFAWFLFAERYASESLQILKRTKQTTTLYYVTGVCQWFSKQQPDLFDVAKKSNKTNETLIYRHNAA